MPLFDRRRVKRLRDGSFRFELPEEEREVLRRLPDQLRTLLVNETEDDPAVARLFPPAYGDDEPEKAAEFARLMRDDLVQHRLAALKVVEETVDATRLEEEEVVAWMGALNDLRLVLGTRLEVTEELEDIDDDDPRAPAFALYHYLTFLQGEVIEALQEAVGRA